MSTTRKRAAKLTALAIILVSALAAVSYFMIPDNPRTRSIAFALGPTSIGPVNSNVYSLSTLVNVTFQNGTVWESLWHADTPAEINSTDITQIVILPAPSYSGGLNLGDPYLATLQYAFDWGICTSLAGESPMELGELQMANYTFGFYEGGHGYPVPWNFSVPRLNYLLQVNTTGYWDIGRPPPFYGPWTWRIDTDRIQNLISNTTNPAEVNFDLDITVNLYYQIMTTNSPTQSGYATVSWSGRWATLQLLHDGNQLTGFRYTCTDISLKMMST